jgi:hypothetical protein
LWPARQAEFFAQRRAAEAAAFGVAKPTVEAAKSAVRIRSSQDRDRADQTGSLNDHALPAAAEMPLSNS